MRKLLVTLALTALLCAQEARANAFDGGGILSFDFGYMGTGFRNSGWGLGAGYERGLIDWASVKFSFSHMTLFTDGDHDDDSLLTTVGIGLNMRVYPFARGLSMLYIGYGLGTDFLMFSGETMENVTYISHCPHIGWKQNFKDIIILDAYLGYRVKGTDPGDFLFDRGIVKQGIEYGISAQLNLSKIWRVIRGR
ncbi:MAG: hypothetical protein IJL80_14400 [Treponema sp.]|nr:hypothetical protein [Treponema sp.]